MVWPGCTLNLSLWVWMDCAELLGGSVNLFGEGSSCKAGYYLADRRLLSACDHGMLARALAPLQPGLVETDNLYIRCA